MGGVMKLIGTVLIAIALIATPSEAAIGCGAVVSYLNPCLPYVSGKGALGGGCCDGIKGLYGSAKTTPDKQSVCNCLKSLAASNTGINAGKAASLPAQCGINIPYKISPSTDCST
ncbi:Non-specific lipid-transfer protein 2, variant 2 [Salvia divinorum]